MAVAESRKRANVKWDAENMTTLGCRVKKEQADRFKAYCSEIGKTSNAVLRDYVLEFIDTITRARSRTGHLFGPHAEAHSESVNGFINRAIDEKP